jgi:hypothetical protein
MKKILFLCDGDNYPQGAFQFLKTMNAQEPVFAKGIFFTPVDYEQLINLSYMPLTAPYERIKTAEIADVSKSREQFNKDCSSAGIRYIISERASEWNKELLVKESRYADCILISEELFCSQTLDTQPNFFMQELLRGSESPVIVVPEKFCAPDRLVFACDGKKESAYAMKQFTYLFPGYLELPAQFVYINKEGESLPDEDLLQEYARWHINAIGSASLQFDPKKYFSTWLETKKNAFLITGSYSRSGFSTLLKPSFADKVIHDHVCPVFIAHL